MNEIRMWMDSELKIWLIGSKNPNADKSIAWDSPFPNLSEPDVLIINLQTLTEDILKRIDKEKLKEAYSTIMDKFFHYGTIIVITAPQFHATDDHHRGHVFSNYYLSPIEVMQTVSVPDGNTVKFDKKHDFVRYLQQVKKFDFFISDVMIEKPLFRINDSARSNYHVMPLESQSAIDNAGRMLAESYSIFLGNPSRSMPVTHVEAIGKVVFLPPTGNPDDDGIDSILFKYGKVTPSY